MSSGGRPCKTSWLDVFGTSKPKSKQTQCIHCKLLIKHNGKSQVVESHRTKCPHYVTR